MSEDSGRSDRKLQGLEKTLKRRKVVDDEIKELVLTLDIVNSTIAPMEAQRQVLQKKLREKIQQSRLMTTEDSLIMRDEGEDSD